jgi:transposase-like protein
MRWTFRRKAELVEALRAGTLTATELELRHGVSAEELLAWIRAYDANGLRGLRVTKPAPADDD